MARTDLTDAVIGRTPAAVSIGRGRAPGGATAPQASTSTALTRFAGRKESRSRRLADPTAKPIPVHDSDVITSATNTSGRDDSMAGSPARMTAAATATSPAARPRPATTIWRPSHSTIRGTGDSTTMASVPLSRSSPTTAAAAMTAVVAVTRTAADTDAAAMSERVAEVASVVR
jgi:hypothetical protein